jgi:hypothetical protein
MMHRAIDDDGGFDDLPEPQMKIKALPCKLCGHEPHLRSRDVHFRPTDDYLFSEIQIECSNPECSKEHRHFAPRATRREAIMAWNGRNVR